MSGRRCRSRARLRVVRTGDLLTSRLNWRRGNLDALSGGRPAHLQPAQPAGGRRRAGPRRRRPGCLTRSRPRCASARAERFDCVLTSSPPQSAHLIGRALRRRGPALDRGAARRLDVRAAAAAASRGRSARSTRALERSTLTRADLVIGVTRADRRWTPRGASACAPSWSRTRSTPRRRRRSGRGADLLDASRHTLVHTGPHGGLAAARPRPLLDALAAPRARRPARRRPRRPALARTSAALVDAAEQRGLVRWVGALERPRALALQRAADALLVVTEGSTRRERRHREAVRVPRRAAADPRPRRRRRRRRESCSRPAPARATSATDPEAIAAALRGARRRPAAAAERGCGRALRRSRRSPRALAELVEEVVSTSERSQTSTL